MSLEFSDRWNAFAREAGIAGHSISSGLEALRKADYTDKGLYSHAFFGLSIGLERLLKLIVLIDYAVLNAGTYPEAEYLKQLGHDIERLHSEARRVHDRLPDREGRYDFPPGGLEDDILAFLARFAKSTRYYNLDCIAGRSSAAQFVDPVAQWSTKIGNQILERHYQPTRRARDDANAILLQKSLGQIMLVRHTAEDGSALNSVQTAFRRGAENRVLQKYGTFYCVKIVRFAYMILYDLEHEAHASGLSDVPFLHELFFPFSNDDAYLKSRKTFPVRG